jgi:hypothetical protein
MSEIRMCDQCGRIFSLNETGWSQYTKTNTFGSNGNTQTLHMCPDHGTATEPVLRPRMAITKGIEDDIHPG